PRTGGEVSEGLAADAARRRVVSGVKRRIADRIVDGQDRNARFAQRLRDAIVRGGLVEILDEEIDLATGRVGGVVERGPDVAARRTTRTAFGRRPRAGAGHSGDDTTRPVYRMPSIPTKLPVMPTARGTVMLKKNVARFVRAASAAMRSVRTFSMMWMPLSVMRRLWTMNASLGSSPGMTSTAHVSAPTATTFWPISHFAASLPMPGSP